MRSIFFIALIGFLVSCGNKTKSKDPSTNDTTSTDSSAMISSYNTDSLLGEYIGGFGNNTIIVSVNYINGKIASGYDIMKGNRRNIKGSILNKGDFFEFELSEPGGDEYDGKFKFKIDTATKTMEGTWTPFDTIKLKSKEYKLSKRKFNHEKTAGFVGHWYLNDLSVQFKADKTGIAKGYWYDAKTENSTEVDEIRFSWFDDKNSVLIEWGKNEIFSTSKMKFKYEKNQYEEMLHSGDYIMYRY